MNDLNWSDRFSGSIHFSSLHLYLFIFLPAGFSFVGFSEFVVISIFCHLSSLPPNYTFYVTVSVLPFLHPALIFSSFTSPAYPTGCSFYILAGSIVILFLLSSNKSNIPSSLILPDILLCLYCFPCPIPL